MTALLVVLGVILGTAAPVSLAAITATQWATIGLVLAKGVPGALRANQALIKELQSPAFRAWVAANGETAIRLQPGESTER